VGYPLPLPRSYFHDFSDVQILICAPTAEHEVL
jgi:hypothetical protein